MEVEDKGGKALIACFVTITALIVVIISGPLPIIARLIIGMSVGLVAIALLKAIFLNAVA